MTTNRCPTCGAPTGDADAHDRATYRAAIDSLKWRAGEGETVGWRYLDADGGVWLLSARAIPYRISVFPVGEGFGYAIDDGIQGIAEEWRACPLDQTMRTAAERAADMTDTAAYLLRTLALGGRDTPPITRTGPSARQLLKSLWDLDVFVVHAVALRRRARIAGGATKIAKLEEAGGLLSDVEVRTRELAADPTVQGDPATIWLAQVRLDAITQTTTDLIADRQAAEGENP